MAVVFDSERMTPSNPVAHIADKGYDRVERRSKDKSDIVTKDDSNVQVWGLSTSNEVHLDVTSYALYDFGRVTTTVSFTPDEAREIAISLMTAAALAEERSV